jgi:hypothetical protein
MTSQKTINDFLPAETGPYLHVVRLGDGRYQVQLVKQGVVPRTSYTLQAEAVVKQAQRAGNIPIHTSDADVQRICRNQSVELI